MKNKIWIKTLIIVGALNLFAASALAEPGQTTVPCQGVATGAAGAPNPAPTSTGTPNPVATSAN